jgi:uncharacterized 2Fe-2S/4Fe-4S cluster protein (DUF4445 family)
MKSYKIIFAPSFKEALGEKGKTILDIAREAGVYINSDCSGKGTCGKCRIRVVEGAVSPFAPEESEFIKKSDRELGYRLACMTSIAGDVRILVPGEDILESGAATKVFS